MRIRSEEPIRVARVDLAIDGLATRVWSSPGAGRTYVLVHGIGMSHRYFTRLHRLLASTGAVVHTVQLPGFGGLPTPRRDLDVHDMAGVLASMLDRLGLDRAAVVVGQSMGAQWVVELAAQRPDLCEAMVLLGPVVDPKRRTVWQQAADLALDTLRESLDMNALVFADYLRCGIPWYTRQLRHMLAFRLDERLLSARVPVLVLRGGRDPIARTRWVRAVAARAQDGRVAVVPGHAHNAHYTAPRAVAAAIDAFSTHIGAAR